MRDPGEFMSTLKVDLYPEEVYTFTPRGKVIVLPRDATPIDFAYAIHSDVGNRCVGAKVNGRIVPLKSALRNGDVVEILTQTGHLPSKDWLALVKTSKARNKIKHVINTTERAKAIEIGEKYLEREARRLGVTMAADHQGADWKRSPRDYGYSKMEDLHAALGYGKFSARQVLQKLAPDQIPQQSRAPVAAAPAPSRPEPPRAGRSGPGHQSQRHRRPAGLSRQVLQPDPRGSHRRICDARQRRRGPFAQLRERAEPDVRSGAQDRRRMGAQRHRRPSR